MTDRRKVLRCAVYTRKSSDEGLEQDFNSLDAQREACEAYVLSQRSEGWTLVPDHFDDGGWSGGKLERPALQALLAAIEAGNIDIVVVYKIDRLTRSLMDFSKLVDVMDRHDVTFVSVTQSFNTTTSMGRLTLNILLSFAQFEREVTGERIRDKIAASKKKGMWMGGHVPIGYEAKDRTLAIAPDEAETVRTIFELYLELKTVPLVEAELCQHGITTKRRIAESGREAGGKPFSRGHIYKLLSNPLYIGEITHKGIRHPGQHPAIIDRKSWDAVQAQLAANTRGSRTRPNSKEPSLLAGLLFDETGRPLTADHAVKNGRRYRYYGVKTGNGPETEPEEPRVRISAGDIEPVISRQLAAFLGRTGELVDRLQLADLRPDELTAVMAAADTLATSLDAGSLKVRREIVTDIVGRIVIEPESLRIELDRKALAERLGAGHVDKDQTDEEPILLDIPVRVSRRGAETKLVIESDAATTEGGSDPALLKAVARGHGWFDELVTGRATSVKQIAGREGLTDRYVARILELAFLPPPVVDDIVAGRQPVTTTAAKLSRAERPLMWAGQQAAKAVEKAIEETIHASA